MKYQECHVVTHLEDRHRYLHPTLSSPLPLLALCILKHSAACSLLSNSMTHRSYLEIGLDSLYFHLFLLLQSDFFKNEGLDEAANNCVIDVHILA